MVYNDDDDDDDGYYDDFCSCQMDGSMSISYTYTSTNGGGIDGLMSISHNEMILYGQ